MMVRSCAAVWLVRAFGHSSGTLGTISIGECGRSHLESCYVQRVGMCRCQSQVLSVFGARSQAAKSAAAAFKVALQLDLSEMCFS